MYNSDVCFVSVIKQLLRVVSSPSQAAFEHLQTDHTIQKMLSLAEHRVESPSPK